MGGDQFGRSLFLWYAQQQNATILVLPSPPEPDHHHTGNLIISRMQYPLQFVKFARGGDL